MEERPDTQHPHDSWYMSAFVAGNLALKLPLTRLNEGEYTDGILQLTVFEMKSQLYPPLYGALAKALEWFGLNLEMAARIISATASSLVVIPLYLMTRRLGGSAAAKIAVLLYTLSPLVLRWAPRVMTDSLFLLMSASSLALMFSAGRSRGVETSSVNWAARLQWGGIFAALAALTRYQGAFLVIPWLLVRRPLIGRFTGAPLLSLLHVIAWAGLPAWIYHHGFVHGSQFSSRTTGDSLTTALAYWSTFESFILISPYYFTYPVIALGVAGIFAARRSPALAQFLILWGVWGVIILGLQSTFTSFQYRYMLPLLPGLLAFSGCGAVELEKWFAARSARLVFSSLFMLSLLFMIMFSCAVLLLQRQSFGDQKDAALYIQENLPAAAPVYANEQYGNFRQLGCVKLSFWSGRKVESVFSMTDNGVELRPLPKGAVLVLSNAYGGNEASDALLKQFTSEYDLKHLHAFTSEIYPIMDDIMVSPVTNQSPLAWVLRYTKQIFSSRVILVLGPRTARSGTP